MFVGASGVRRTIKRTCEAMKEAGIEDPYDVAAIRSLNVIDLPTMQKKVNLHYTLSLDLFGSEISTNAANTYNASLKGRYREDRLLDDHRLLDATYPVLKLVDHTAKLIDEPALTALNMRLRDDYSDDALAGIQRWNREIARAGIDFEIKLPHVTFNRAIGQFAGIKATPEGEFISAADWTMQHGDWLPSPGDGDFIASLMEKVTEPGHYAGWIAPPREGIDNKPTDYEYVRIH